MLNFLKQLIDKKKSNRVIDENGDEKDEKEKERYREKQKKREKIK